MRLDEINRKMTITEVNEFLVEHKDSFKRIAESNECRKWSKWLSRNERPFPCACPTRNEDCMLAEIYYELSKVAGISSFESACEEAMMDFYSIKEDDGDDTLLKKWIEDNQTLLSEVSKFEKEISITKSRKPYEELTINVEFPKVFRDFTVIFTIAEVGFWYRGIEG